jgi:uncharacterized protein (TIGR03067 family)
MAETTAPSDELVWRELRPLLDEEIDRLPEHYRAPVVLCYLEGKTNDEAAQLLGCPRGTVAGRLSRARALLRRRLEGRGVTSPPGALAALPLAEAAAVPAALAQATLAAARGGTAPAGALALAAATITAMRVQIMKAILVAVFTVALVGMTAAVLYSRAKDGGPAAGGAPQGGAARQPPDDRELLQGAWEVAAAEFHGHPRPADSPEVAGVTWTFRGDTLLLRFAGQAHQRTYRLDPDARPRRIDVIARGVAGREYVQPGIYELDGGRLRICLNVRNERDRPGQFKTTDRDDFYLRAFQRPAGQAQPKAGQAAEPMFFKPGISLLVPGDGSPQGKPAPKQVELPADPRAVVLLLDYRGGFTVKRLHDEPHLVVRAGGDFLVNDPYRGDKVQGRLDTKELQAVMAFVIHDQRFLEIDPARLVEAAGLPKGARGPGIIDAQDTVIRVRTAAREHEVVWQVLALEAGRYPKVTEFARLRAVEERLQRLMAELRARARPK